MQTVNCTMFGKEKKVQVHAVLVRTWNINNPLA